MKITLNSPLCGCHTLGFLLLLQVAITLALTRVLGKLFSYLHQPQVIGEIVAGIILGPSVLGRSPGKHSVQLHRIRFLRLWPCKYTYVYACTLFSVVLLTLRTCCIFLVGS